MALRRTLARRLWIAAPLLAGVFASPARALDPSVRIVAGLGVVAVAVLALLAIRRS